MPSSAFSSSSSWHSILNLNVNISLTLTTWEPSQWVWWASFTVAREILIMSLSSNNSKSFVSNVILTSIDTLSVSPHQSTQPPESKNCLPIPLFLFFSPSTLSWQGEKTWFLLKARIVSRWLKLFSFRNNQMETVHPIACFVCVIIQWSLTNYTPRGV
jgi:hypothetical protein